MSSTDDWQDQLIPRRIDYRPSGRKALDAVRDQTKRGDEIMRGLLDVLKDCAHQGPVVHGPVHEWQANIPNTNKRICCQYTFDDRTVWITDVYIIEFDFE